MEAEVHGFLAQVRTQATELRARVAEYNQASGRPQAEMTKVITYVGQTFLEPEIEERTTDE